MKYVQTSRDGMNSDSRRTITRTGGNRTAARGFKALVVDDDPAALKLAAAMVGKIGFVVHTAGESTQVLSDISRPPGDLVLTDLEMPGVNGYQLGRKIKARHPGTRVVIMTGLNRTAVTGLMSDGSIDGWLFKPFNLSELQTLLQRVGLLAKEPRKNKM
jgi:two-component system response regulator YesN